MANRTGKVLIVIDVQNDYFPGGLFPLWNAEATLAKIEAAIAGARRAGIPVVLVQHVVDAPPGAAPFFGKGTAGAGIHHRILAAAPGAPIIVKKHADSFAETDLDATLAGLGVTELLVCGMMTHNCVTHTAISKTAEKYKVAVLPECSTTVSEILHQLALHALSLRVPMKAADEMLRG